MAERWDIKLLNTFLSSFWDILFPLTGWATHVAFSDVVDPLPGRLRLVIEDFGNSPFTAVRITAFVHAVVRLCAVCRWDQHHQIKGFPVIVLDLDLDLDLDNITERSALAHAFFHCVSDCRQPTHGIGSRQARLTGLRHLFFDQRTVVNINLFNDDVDPAVDFIT